MTVLDINKDRKIIPRWREFEETLSQGELGSFKHYKAHKKITVDFLSSKLADWRKYRTKFHAADLVGAALTLGREKDHMEAARFLLLEDTNSSVWMRKLAQRTLHSPANGSKLWKPSRILRDFSLQELSHQVSTFRQLLRIEPRDAIVWVDLSRVYLILGETSKAEQCMTVALQLASNNRFVLRSASRLWIHLGNPLKAYDIISRADCTPYDPWLLAAEVAIADLAEKKPRFVQSGRRILDNKIFSAAHVSELASALATLELGHDNLKQSKKLFTKSLEEPNENSLAQATWVSNQTQSINFDFDKYSEIKNRYEASYYNMFYHKEWDLAVNMSRQWRDDQPFSVEPFICGSYVLLTMLDKYQEGKEFSEAGLTANQWNLPLLNNMVVADIYSGKIEDAKKTMLKIERNINVSTRSRREQVVFMATRGLLAFRTGNREKGRQLYLEALKMANDEQEIELQASVMVFHLIEELKNSNLDCSHLIAKAHKKLSTARKLTLNPIIETLEEKLKIACEPHPETRHP